ncbi:hypothetical protein MBRA_57060 (plasmid) [Mycobacterium branderi]|uniref:Uncharacterized protein n=1 Tax=Mycobacterium branderi TaxID=43348 RepID=A0ABN6BG96_9MYCO|nr:hypothetical protein MBRA_57060 [Mycobacterium branderi]
MNGSVHGIDRALDERGQQTVLVAEVVVERTDTHTGLVCEAAHRQLLDSMLLEKAPRGIQYMPASAFLGA